MAAPRQMTANTLNALKGWPSPSAVDFEAKISSAALTTRDPILAGTVMRLNTSGTLELGVGTNAAMPLFLFPNSDDPDVENDGGDASSEAGVFVPIAPTGVVMCLVANGAYELVSTAYVTTDASNMTPNAHLTAAASGGDEGLLITGTVYTDTIVGVVSRGIVDNGYGHNAVAFWPWYIPPTP